ncbi:transporter substrate-binding domain-containing protein [Paenibacillus sp. NPDC056579]|uniref:transporter substrate-binding domain-containing protein n=1 Tax=unclassified Paenibacillus TaxID=185978 RepID=UPI001EF8A350|nr:transporter substrate-binding domain-containing protein [Paenibacillus sp. H1-7]ULL18435.1 glutamine ABC transporter substrate-bindnig protein [Paenibacillus sp. H1-7]
MRVTKAGKRGLLLTLLLTLAVTAGCTADKRTVKVGIESNFRPFTYTEGGENKGFEVELWKVLAKKANLEYELVPMDSGEITRALSKGDIDLAVAGMTVNKARKDNFAFSDPYFQTGLVILTAADNNQIKGKDDLAQKVIATKNGTTAYTYAGNIQGAKEIRGYPDITEAYDALVNKNVDAVIFDERNVHDYLQNSGKGKAKMVGEVLNKESYAVVAKKKNNYMGRINGAIETVSKDGTYEALYKQWFGGQPKKLPGE